MSIIIASNLGGNRNDISYELNIIEFTLATVEVGVVFVL